MQRLATTPRADWRAHVERDLGFSFHTIDGAPYWDETACYRFSAAEIDKMKARMAGWVLSLARTGR